MVDINLIGEEEKREPVAPQEEPVRQGIDLDSSTFPGREDSGSNSSSYPPFDDERSGSARKIIIAGTLVLAVFIAGYFFFKGDDSTDEILETLSEPGQEELLTENAPSGEELTIPEETGAPETAAPERATSQQEFADVAPPRANAPARTTITPVERSMVESLQAGYAAIDNVSTAISGRANLSLIRISGDSFILEVVANSDSDLAGLLSRVRSALQADDARIVHQENYPIHGPTSVKATIAGTLNRAALAAGSITSPQFFALNEFLSWLRSMAQQSGLAVRSVKQSGTTSEQGYGVTPIQISMDGSLRGALSFLQTFASASPNLRIEKISLINKDPRVNSNDAMSLVLVVHHFSR